MTIRLRRVTAALAGALLLSAPHSPASGQTGAPTGVIRGLVDVRVPPAEHRPAVGDLGGATAHEPDVPRAVVYLESAPAPAFDDAEPPRVTLDQRNETFIPHVLAITVGTTVDFLNSDRIYHNVFSLSAPKKFDLGHYAAGRSKPVRFDRPGIVRVFCEIHSHMSAFILVFSHRYFSVTGADGRYQIGRVPPGRYTLIAWNEGAIRESRAITVPEDGGAVDADFTLR